MNKEQEQRFFDQIEEVLHAHEETYERDAWEEFDANRKKSKQKRLVYWWAAAAVVLFFVSLGLFELTKKDEIVNDQILVKNNKEQYNVKEDSSMLSSGVHKSIENDAIEVLRLAPKHKNILPIELEKSVDSNIMQKGQVVAVENPGEQPQNAVVSIITSADEKSNVQKADKYSPVLPGAYDSLINRNQAKAITKKMAGKLTYSLVVSPSVSNQKMNFGAGMELSFPLGDRLSLSSGLMYAALNAKSDGNSRVVTNSQSQGASLAISGIELPLGIQYKTKGGFYAAAGVSALGLISDKLQYSFLEEKTVAQTSAGYANEVFKVVSEQKTEKSIEPLNNYMGFFNFSAGKKQAFGKVNLNIGPFVKVPFSSVSSEKIRLLQGGVKISVDF